MDLDKFATQNNQLNICNFIHDEKEYGRDEEEGADATMAVYLFLLRLLWV